jgi:hypothetical protein
MILRAHATPGGHNCGKLFGAKKIWRCCRHMTKPAYGGNNSSFSLGEIEITNFTVPVQESQFAKAMG